MTCPVCGASVPEAARFCPTCGHQLAAPAEERRVVTVVFADLVGFTGMSESRDPEQVKNLVDTCFERLAADVTAHGGRVDKIVGDALIALFGAPLAHEDDAERAVRAALQMQTAVASSASRLDPGVRVRIGVNTGEVLVGALRAGGDYTAMGDVMNVANRLQSIASPGEVLVGPHTWLATRDVISYEPLGHVEVRGRDEPVEAWRALEAVAPPGARTRDHLAPLVGRDTELAMLCDALQIGVTHRRRQLLLLVGDAGMGKSRLAREVSTAAASEHDALVLEGHCVPYGETSAWWPLAEILRELCGISMRDHADVARTKCRDVVAAAFPEGSAEEHDRLVDGLLWLTGVEGLFRDLEAARAREEAFRALGLVVDQLAAERPVVVVISDVQWADQQVLDALDHVLSRPARVPFVLVATARPEFEGKWELGSSLRSTTVLNLDPLPLDAAGRLLDALLGSDVPAEERAMILERSGGNPFFLEELAKLMEESGMLSPAETRDSGDHLLALPVTLRGIVAARLDALSPQERGVLEDAAVLGRRGPVEALEALALGRGEARTRSLVDDLAARDLLVVESGGTRFKSDLVREVAYGTLTKAERARRHARLAAWLEEAAGADADAEHLEELARHWATAAELVAELGTVSGVPDDVKERALVALSRAADRSDELESHKVTERLYSTGLRLLGGEEGELRRTFLVGRAKARAALREHSAARADLDVALVEAREAGDVRSEGRALTVVGEVERGEGDLSASARTLQHAVELLRADGDRRGEAAALRRLGFTRMFAGDLDGAERAATEALEVFTELDVRKGVAWALQNLAWIAFSRGDPALAEERIDASVAKFREIGDTGGLGWARGLQAWVWYFQGRTKEAVALAERMLGDARERGDRWALGMMQVLVGSVRLWEGGTDEAMRLAAEAREGFGELGDGYGRALSVAVLARALLAAGRMSELEDLMREEQDLVKGSGGAPAEFGPTITANMAVQLGDGERALRELGLLGEGTPKSTMTTAERDIVVGLALVQIGHAEEGVTALEEAVSHVDSDGPRAFGLAALALGRAAAGDRTGTEAAATQLLGLEAGTYLDRFTASVACALAAARDGDEPAARAALRRAVGWVEATGDNLAKAVVALARGWVEQALGSADAAATLAEARERLASMGVRTDGWDRAFRSAAVG